MAETPGKVQHTGSMGKWSLLAMGIGSVVGSGIVTLVGQAMGVTGYSTFLAYALALLMGFIYNIPKIFVTGALRIDGGPYGLINSILGKKFGGMYAFGFFLYFPTTALYALSFGTYVQSLLPGASVRATAAIVLTVFYLVNLCGIKTLSNLQNLMSVLLIVGLGTFFIMGIGKADVSLVFNTADPQFMTDGAGGFFSATFILFFSTFAQYYVMFMSRHSKNSKHDMPFAMIGTTIVIAVLYLSVTVVASTVLPLEIVANQPLTYVAQEIMPKPLFIFFIIAGPFMALATTINGCYACYLEPIYVATQNGWFPASFAKQNRYGSAWKIMTIMWLVSLLPLVLGWDIKMTTNSSLLVNLTLSTLMIVSIAMVPKKYPEIWAKRGFGKNVPTGMFYFFVFLSLLVQIAIIAHNIVSVKPYIVVITVLVFGFGIFYAIKKEKTGGIHVETLDFAESD